MQGSDSSGGGGCLRRRPWSADRMMMLMLRLSAGTGLICGVSWRGLLVRAELGDREPGKKKLCVSCTMK